MQLIEGQDEVLSQGIDEQPKIVFYEGLIIQRSEDRMRALEKLLPCLAQVFSMPNYVRSSDIDVIQCCSSQH